MGSEPKASNLEVSFISILLLFASRDSSSVTSAQIPFLRCDKRHYPLIYKEFVSFVMEGKNGIHHTESKQ